MKEIQKKVNLLNVVTWNTAVLSISLSLTTTKMCGNLIPENIYFYIEKNKAM